MPVDGECRDGKEIDDVGVPAFGFPQRLLRPSLLGDVDDADEHVRVGIGKAGNVGFEDDIELFPCPA